jgi:methionyl-tRNA formyltransferase
VFFLTDTIDEGLIIQQEKVGINSDTSMNDLYNKITFVGGKLLVNAIADIDSDNIKKIMPSGSESYYPMPNRDSMRRFLRLKKRFF